MPYVSIMTAFELGDPVLLFVLVKTHDTPIHASPKPWPMCASRTCDRSIFAMADCAIRSA